MVDTAVVSLAAFLRASGPYGLVAPLALAFWRVIERKDQEVRALYEKVEQLATRQTEAIAKMEAALVALKEAIENMRR